MSNVHLDVHVFRKLCFSKTKSWISNCRHGFFFQNVTIFRLCDLVWPKRTFKQGFAYLDWIQIDKAGLVFLIEAIHFSLLCRLHFEEKLWYCRMGVGLTGCLCPFVGGGDRGRQEVTHASPHALPSPQFTFTFILIYWSAMMLKLNLIKITTHLPQALTSPQFTLTF